MRRLLLGCEVVAFDETDAHRAGALLGRSRTSDIVDAAVVVLANERGAAVVTGDPKDIARLVAVMKPKASIEVFEP